MTTNIFSNSCYTKEVVESFGKDFTGIIQEIRDNSNNRLSYQQAFSVLIRHEQLKDSGWRCHQAAMREKEYQIESCWQEKRNGQENNQ